MREFLEEFRDNWRDSYWWADHQGLRAFLVGVMLGTLGLVFGHFESRRPQRVEIVSNRNNGRNGK